MKTRWFYRVPGQYPAGRTERTGISARLDILQVATIFSVPLPGFRWSIYTQETGIMSLRQRDEHRTKPETVTIYRPSPPSPSSGHGQSDGDELSGRIPNASDFRISSSSWTEGVRVVLIVLAPLATYPMPRISSGYNRGSFVPGRWIWPGRRRRRVMKPAMLRRREGGPGISPRQHIRPVDRWRCGCLVRRPGSVRGGNRC